MTLIPTNEETEEFKKQILNLFAPSDKLLAAEVSIRLEERTGGRKVIKDSKVISFLDMLVKEERLSKQQQEEIIRGHELKVTRYFLPKI